ncbi:MAG: hypothetical protein CVV64_08530 [Candidatus Wallbacteria bacterium HGW-Wallbacteria-1]|jgi:hypothetical protein|uniref:Uncharacterized protein n=1 Tax=Candidatus Wallbacteria bacterium HGW-Wallbacteria-1 TaxID=2013854 RepID=A0A2N1PPY9_9BACT|nr:MAG: hypothetical protein CVV64_08530 [Candidatus Wallbacteria bacterium HGW-Wallbacteria-1]
MAKSRSPKHKITTFATEKQEFGESVHDKFHKEMKLIFDLVGKHVIISFKAMKTPECKVKEIFDTRMEDIGRVLMIIGEDGKTKFPLRIPDQIIKSEGQLKLVYEVKIPDDAEAVFYKTRSCVETREDSVITIFVRD